MVGSFADTSSAFFPKPLLIGNVLTVEPTASLPKETWSSVT